MADNKYRFYHSQDYWQELTARIRETKKGDRLLLMSMTFDPTEPLIHVLVVEIQKALRRGVSVKMAVDAHTFMVGSGGFGPLWTNRELPKSLHPYFQNKYDILEAINAIPHGHATIINAPGRRFSLPVAGRSHIKIALINDDIFIGGCNLEKAHWIDMMINWQDSKAAGWLYGSMSSIIDAKHAGKALDGVDRKLKVDDTTSIYIDSGTRKQSLILDEALALIDAAQDWLLITCQYFPNSITAQHLLRAHKRGVKVEIIFAHPKHQGVIGGLGQHYSILREKSRLPRELFRHALDRRDPMLHAKLLTCDKGLMIGSHNYVTAGVILGTAEIALKSTDKRLAKEAVKTLRKALRSSTSNH